MIYYPNYAAACIGITYPAETDAPVVVYDQNAVLQQLKDDGMSDSEAYEFFEFNVLGTRLGPGTPIFVERMTQDEAVDEAIETSEVRL